MSIIIWNATIVLLVCCQFACGFQSFHRHALRSTCHRYQYMKASDAPKDAKKPQMTLGKLAQLMAMGAGAPMLGEFKEIDADGKMIFELEANNLVDSEGNSIQTKAKYFRDGYVEVKDDLSPPGFWGNLISGGRLQGEWEAKILANKDGKK
jgi:hypothetical protein